MAVLSNALLALRRDDRVLTKLPKWLSLIVTVAGLGWLFLLPLNEYSRRTYVSENALLPGQVHTYFANSEHNVFRAYRHEVASFQDLTTSERVQRTREIFKTHGLKAATQKYNFTSPTGDVLKAGENVYAILQGPRADATEAMVLISAWRNMDNKINYSGVALVLTLARYFARWSLWSKDIIFLIPDDSTAGSQAWVDAYHNAHNPAFVEPLTLKSGALQGAVALDYPAGPWGHRYDKLHIIYDGINGALPNLDLLNTAVSIASGQMGIGCTLKRMFSHNDGYTARLLTLARGMLNQGLGHATGPHSPFIPYHVDAITIQTVGDGWHDEMSLGRSVEGLFRSLNNLLEHLHQSFFFYLLMEAKRFVSIGTYLPSAMLVAGSFTIMSIALWVQSGRPGKPPANPASTTPKSNAKPEKQDMTVISSADNISIIPTTSLTTQERHLFLPLTLLTSIHFLSLLPLYTFNTLPSSLLVWTFHTFTLISIPLPYMLADLLPGILGRRITRQERTLVQCFSLMLLGLFLSALATLNFSLALIIGVLASPLAFIRPLGNTSPLNKSINVLQALTMILISPPVVITLATTFSAKLIGGGGGGGGGGTGEGSGVSLEEILKISMQGWWIHGMWTSLVVWVVWWPGWFVGCFVVACGVFEDVDGGGEKAKVKRVVKTSVVGKSASR